MRAWTELLAYSRVGGNIMRDAAEVLPAEPVRTIKLRLALRGKTFLKPTIIFDLDGTLVDSLDDLQTAVNATLQALARPALERATVAPMIGDGARAPSAGAQCNGRRAAKFFTTACRLSRTL